MFRKIILIIILIVGLFLCCGQKTRNQEYMMAGPNLPGDDEECQSVVIEEIEQKDLLLKEIKTKKM